jgi:hypothetical protein
MRNVMWISAVRDTLARGDDTYRFINMGEYNAAATTTVLTQ